MLTATGGALGVVRGLPVLFGIISGFALMIFLLALGLGSTVLANPTLLGVLKYAGVAMLLWLSWAIATAPARHAGSVEAQAMSKKPIGFFGAALFQWVNPKAWLVAASAITAYSDTGMTGYAQALTFAGVFILSGFLGCLPWLAFGAAIKHVLQTPRAQQVFNIAMGLALAASVALIIN